MHKHRINLALTYLGIIMVLSLSFSFMFYHEATRAAGSGFRRQVNELKNNIYFASPDALERIRDKGIDRFNDSVLARLIFLNLIMLVAGGLLSYYLAKISLEPLEQAFENQSRFTSDAAHELRTPLTVMKTENEIALRAKQLTSADAKEVLKSNLEEINKLQILTEALLRLAKNGDKPDMSTWKRVPVTEVLQAAYDRVKPAASTRKIGFNLPEPSKIAFKGDQDQLVELFVTLFDNAIKYGKDKTSVDVTALKNDHQIVVKVQDHGVGIAAEDLPHIFERFYRADQSRTKITSEGYGLGLSVAEAIVKSHGGSITATSKQDDGTIFTVSLPR